MKETIATYYKLTKPGIIYGNALAAIGGFLLASRGDIDAGLFLAMLIGSSLVIGSACVYNNVLDRNIDKVMVRTKKRALPAGKVSVPIALVYGTILGLTGLTLLALFTNWLTTVIAFMGLFFYVIVYGFAKRKTIHGTLVGTISGATPPVIGYVAVTNNIDLGAVLLFLILVAWQMPHFYALALFKRKDYAAAKIPVLPIVYGTHATVVQTLAYMGLFLVAALQLTAAGYTGVTYAIIIALASLWWLRLGVRGLVVPDPESAEQWGKQVFIRSIHVLTIFCILISLDNFLP